MEKNNISPPAVAGRSPMLPLLAASFFLWILAVVSYFNRDSILSNVIHAGSVRPSAEKSLVFVQRLPTGSGEECRNKILVFVRSAEEKALMDRPVRIEIGEAGSSPVAVEPQPVQTTDIAGKAEFFVSSRGKGRAGLVILDVLTGIRLGDVSSLVFD